MAGLCITTIRLWFEQRNLNLSVPYKLSASISYEHTVPDNDNFYLFVRRWIPFSPILPESWKDSSSCLHTYTLTQQKVIKSSHMHAVPINQKKVVHVCSWTAPQYCMQVPGIQQKVLHAWLMDSSSILHPSTWYTTEGAACLTAP